MRLTIIHESNIPLDIISNVRRLHVKIHDIEYILYTNPSNGLDIIKDTSSSQPITIIPKNSNKISIQ